VFVDEVRRVTACVLALAGLAAGCSAARKEPTTPAPEAQPVQAATSPKISPRISPCVAPTTNGDAEAGEVESATEGLHCCTYLRHTKTKKPSSRVVFVQGGTGIYTTAGSGSLGAVAKHAPENEDTTAPLTMDKPGIHLDAKTGRAAFDRDEYRQYTLADLTTCGRNAITWAYSRTQAVARDASLTLHGHSEGGQMMIRILAAAAAAPTMKKLPNVERAILTGLLIEPFADATARQIEVFMPFEIEAFHDAIANHDDDYLLSHALSTRYLTHPSAHESLEASFIALAAQPRHFPIDLFHGDRDINAPLAAVTRLTSQNEAARKEGRPSLDLRLHVYRGARHNIPNDQRFAADVRALNN